MRCYLVFWQVFHYILKVITYRNLISKKSMSNFLSFGLRLIWPTTYDHPARTQPTETKYGNGRSSAASAIPSPQPPNVDLLLIRAQRVVSVFCVHDRVLCGSLAFCRRWPTSVESLVSFEQRIIQLWGKPTPSSHVTLKRDHIMVTLIANINAYILSITFTYTLLILNH